MKNDDMADEMEAALYQIANYLSYGDASVRVPIPEPNESVGDYRNRLILFTLDQAKAIAAARRV